MIAEGNRLMEKSLGQKDFSGLEAEIDSAVDRLFVEENDNPTTESTSTESPMSKSVLDSGKAYQDASSPLEEEKRIVFENPIFEKPFPESLSPTTHHAMDRDPFRESAPARSLSISPPEEEHASPKRTCNVEEHSSSHVDSDPMERLESQLLSLEQKITKEGIKEMRDAVGGLRDRWEGRSEVLSVLNRMESVLDSLSTNETNDDASLIRFLRDAKETMKVVVHDDWPQQKVIYKQLALDGIEARFSSLYKPGDIHRASFDSAFPFAWNKINQIAEKIDAWAATVERSLDEIGQRLGRLEKQSDHKPLRDTLVVFTLDGQFFGVHSDHVFKLFKVPGSLCDRYSDQQHIRIGGLDVKLVDLEKKVPLARRPPGQDRKILVVKDDEGYKGLLIERILQKVSMQLLFGEGSNDLLMGSFPWTYEEQPIEISVLNVKKL